MALVLAGCHLAPRLVGSASAERQEVALPTRGLPPILLGSDGETYHLELAGDEEMVVSFPIPSRFAGAPSDFERIGGRSYLYDGALLALFRTLQGDERGAARVLGALQALQLEDGAWGFSLDWEEGSYDSGYVRTGTVAWIVYAFARFEARFGETRFAATARRGGLWLLEQREETTGLVLVGRGVWTPQGLAPAPSQLVVTEHQIDAYFAWAALAALAPEGPWAAAASALADRILAMLWIEEEGRFAQGKNEAGLDRGSAVDAAGAWGALFLLAIGEEAKARRALSWVDLHHGLEETGYRPYASGPELAFVEAAAAVALAWHRLEPEGERARTELEALRALRARYGLPLPYSDRWEEDFPMAPAAAPTLWYWFAEAEMTGRSETFLWRERT